MTEHILQKEELLKVFEKTGSALRQALDEFDRESLNMIPFEGSWTAGQVGEHILKSLSGMPKLFLESTKPSERPEYKKVRDIKNIFLDLNAKFKARESILPGSGPYEKEKLMQSIMKAWDDLTQIIREEDLSLICLNSIVPVFGEMTRMEWGYLVVFHTQRHIHQLAAIHKSILGKQSILK
jgi:hypothetical protein